MVPLLGEAVAGAAGAAGVAAADLHREMSPAAGAGGPLRISDEDFERDRCCSLATGTGVSPAPDDVLVPQVILDACRAGELDILEAWQRRHRALGLTPRLQDLRDHQVSKRDEEHGRVRHT